MKKMILPAICFLIIAETTSAQTRNSRHRASTANSAVAASATTHQKETATTAQPDNSREAGNILITVIPDNRKEYMQDGQLATYTGHQATAINAGEFQSLRKTDNEIRRKDDDQKE